jgi:2'-5' RNA ligase
VAGRFVDPARYHVTLLFLGEYAEPPDDIATAAATAAGTVAAPSFDLALDALRAFPKRRPPWVLAGAGEGTPVAALSEALRAALTQAAVPHEAWRPFVPHLTLLYGEQGLAAPRPIAPITWHAREFHLVESRTGVAGLVRRARFALD